MVVAVIDVYSFVLQKFNCYLCEEYGLSKILRLWLRLTCLKMQKLCHSGVTHCFPQLFLMFVEIMGEMDSPCFFCGVSKPNFYWAMMLISQLRQSNERRYSFPLLAIRVNGSWMSFAALSCFLQ